MDGGPDMTSSLQLWKPITRLYDKIGWIKSRSLYSFIYERETNTKETKKVWKWIQFLFSTWNRVSASHLVADLGKLFNSIHLHPL